MGSILGYPNYGKLPYIIVILGLLGLYWGYIEQLVKVGRGSFHNPGGILVLHVSYKSPPF